MDKVTLFALVAISFFSCGEETAVQQTETQEISVTTTNKTPYQGFVEELQKNAIIGYDEDFSSHIITVGEAHDKRQEIAEPISAIIKIALNNRCKVLVAYEGMSWDKKVSALQGEPYLNQFSQYIKDGKVAITGAEDMKRFNGISDQDILSADEKKQNKVVSKYFDRFMADGSLGFTFGSKMSYHELIHYCPGINNMYEKIKNDKEIIDYMEWHKTKSKPFDDGIILKAKEWRNTYDVIIVSAGCRHAFGLYSNHRVPCLVSEPTVWGGNIYQAIIVDRELGLLKCR